MTRKQKPQKNSKHSHEESPKKSRGGSQPPTLDRRTVLRFMGQTDYRPMRFSELAEAMGLQDEQTVQLSELLHDLRTEGIVVNLKHKGLALARDTDLIRGTITLTRSGAAFVSAKGSKREIFIPGSNTGTALPGDTVLVRLTRGREAAGSRLSEGVVVRVEERANRTIVGAVRRGHRAWFVEPMQATISHRIVVAEIAGAQEGDRVLVELDPWEDPQQAPEGRIVEVIGPEDDPAFDTLSVIKSHDLPLEFPAAVIDEAEKATIDESTIAERVDFRKRFVFTIDPATARDFDDALSLERTKLGWRLGVHIADVSHFVQPGSALDECALERATSVYLPDRVIPMLPEQLSNGLCSLQENRDRLAFSVFITLSDEAEIKKVNFAETVIHSRLRLSYEQALEVLEAPEDKLPDFITRKAADKLLAVNRLARKLRAERFAAGSLEMSVPEIRIVVGDDGRIEALQPQTTDEAHQLIEECMILANQEVCRALSLKGWTHMHRIHEEPDPLKLAELEERLVASGIIPGDLTRRENMNALLENIADLPTAHAWNTAVLRSLKRAAYSHQQVGHYGLAKEFYSHFTSPIRRYPDLVEHRMLKAALLRAKTPYPPHDVAEIALHCSELENRAKRAERDVVELKKLRYFSEQLERGNPLPYRAIVTDVRNHGAMVDIPQVQAIGMVHISHLEHDFFDYDAARRELRGRRTGDVITTGTELSVIVAKVNVAKRFLDFIPVSIDPKPGTKAKKKGSKPARPPAKDAKNARSSKRPKSAKQEKRDKKRRG